jgi:outer membrane protein assembly factor BamB
VTRVSPSGEAGWTFSRADFGRGTWPAIVGDSILSTDDGVFLVDRETGKYHGKELDVWGEPLAFGDLFYVDNTFQLDSAGPFVAAFDRSLKWKWRASEISLGKGPKIPRTGGIAAADGLIVHAAARGGRGIPSLSAHDARTGDRRWTAKDIWPASASSIAEGRVFTVEQWKGEKANRLVARSLENGDVAWSATLPWARGPAPVIGGRFVLMHLADEVRAYDRSNGELAWSRPVPRKAPFEEHATTMAVAMGSRTVVVTSGPRMVILDLEDGKEQWSSALVSGSSVTQIGGITIDRPIVIGRAVYVISDGALLRLDPTKRRE